jgi:hypothetical protein
MEKLISQMEQLQIKLAKLEQQKGEPNVGSKQRPCLFCDDLGCIGAKMKKDCPVLRPYLEDGLITFNDRGFFSDKDGKPLPLRVRQGGIKGDLEKAGKIPSSKHIKLSTTIPEIPSSDGMISKALRLRKRR